MRDGTDRDQQALKATFKSYGFEIVIEENLAHDQILEAIRNIVKQGVNYDSVFVVILSHGCNGNARFSLIHLQS